jgi:hypothetical protein
MEDPPQPKRVPADGARSETLSDGSMLVWDPDLREAAWIHGHPTPVER